VGLRFAPEKAPAGAKKNCGKTFLSPHPGLVPTDIESHGCTVGYFRPPLRAFRFSTANPQFQLRAIFFRPSVLAEAAGRKNKSNSLFGRANFILSECL
jgi:hypothetical protein